MAVALAGLLCLLLHSMEEEYPLFHPQNGGTLPGYAYYLCYLYPRPRYWVGRALDWLDPPPH